jgi:hypothetical protein
MEEACDTFTTFIPNTHHPALRQMFTLFARTMECYASVIMECYASVIRAKMADEGGGTPRRASALRKEPNA